MELCAGLIGRRGQRSRRLRRRQTRGVVSGRRGAQGHAIVATATNAGHRRMRATITQWRHRRWLMMVVMVMMVMMMMVITVVAGIGRIY